MKIYTKKGDKGETSLFDNKRVPKDHIRVESYGTIDELGSFIGLAKNYVEDEEIYHSLQDIQNKLFVVASYLATEDKEKIKNYLEEKDVEDLENLIDKYMGKINSPNGFIVAGTNKKAGFLHIARTVCRRGERRIITLSGEAEIDPLIVKYVNRLSDALYAIARYLEDEEIKVNY